MVHFLFALLFAGPAAVSAVAVDAHASVVRREGSGSVDLSASGEVHMQKAEGKLKNCPLLVQDYPKGVEKTNGCDQPADATTVHERVIDPLDCHHAAQLANAGNRHTKDHYLDNTGNSHTYEFFLSSDGNHLRERPSGCFAELCDQTEGSTDTTICYRFNDVEVTTYPDPVNITQGTPICTRPRFANGVSTPNDVTNGCPKYYAPIMDTNLCKSAGECFGENEPGHPFNIGALNASQHDDHPIGCFWQRRVTVAGVGGESTGGNETYVYYNPVETGFAVPKSPNPNSIPICNVTSVTTW